MAEEEKVVCKHCGKEFSKAGIKNHEKACPENPDNKTNIEIRDIDGGKPVEPVLDIKDAIAAEVQEELCEVRVNCNLRTYIGDRYYKFVKGEVQEVPLNVKEVLKTAGMLEVI